MAMFCSSTYIERSHLGPLSFGIGVCPRKSSIYAVVSISILTVAVSSIVTSIPIAHHLLDQSSSSKHSHMIVRIIHHGQGGSQAHGNTIVCDVASFVRNVRFLRPLSRQDQIRRSSRRKKESNEATVTPDACTDRSTRASAHSSCKLEIEFYMTGKKIG